MCATVSPSTIEFVIFSKMWNLISLFWWGSEEKKRSMLRKTGVRVFRISRMLNRKMEVNFQDLFTKDVTLI